MRKPPGAGRARRLQRPRTAGPGHRRPRAHAAAARSARARPLRDLVAHGGGAQHAADARRRSRRIDGPLLRRPCGARRPRRGRSAAGRRAGVLGLLGVALTAVAFQLAPSLVGRSTSPIGWRTKRGAAALGARAGCARADRGLGSRHARRQRPLQALAGAMWGSAAVYALAIVGLVQPDAPLELLAVATALRYMLLLASSIALGRPSRGLPVATFPVPRERARGRRLCRRMQLSALTGFANRSSMRW